MSTEATELPTYEKPLPPVTKLNAPFWEGTLEGELRLQQCNESGTYFYPPSTHSPVTLKRDYSWKPVSGRGKVWSWVVFHQRYFKAFEADLPYNVSLIELDEGVMFMATVRGVAPEDMRCELPVRVEFERVSDTHAVPYFVVDTERAEG